MAFHVRDPAAEQAVRRLARRKSRILTETIREADGREYAAVLGQSDLAERLKPLQARFRELSRPGGAPADKAFFDALSEDA
jgi:antitoxin VapB